jgi:hypothetical protein
VCVRLRRLTDCTEETEGLCCVIVSRRLVMCRAAGLGRAVCRAVVHCRLIVNVFVSGSVDLTDHDAQLHYKTVRET